LTAGRGRIDAGRQTAQIRAQRGVNAAQGIDQRVEDRIEDVRLGRRAVASGLSPNAKNTPAMVPAPSTRRRPALRCATADFRLLFCRPAIAPTSTLRVFNSRTTEVLSLTSAKLQGRILMKMI